jgi:hypothetical protein
LSVDASKKLGALSLYADFVRRCTWTAANEALTEQDITASAIGPPALLVITKRVWPPYVALAMDFITQQCPSLFKGIGHLGPPVGFDRDPNVKPTLSIVSGFPSLIKSRQHYILMRLQDNL